MVAVKTYSFILLGLMLSATAFGAPEIICQTEFTMAPYKKNSFGKFKRDHQDKFNNTIVEGTMSVKMPVNKDRSAYFTYSSHHDGTDRLATYYKAQLNAENEVKVTLNFTVNGTESIPQVELLVNGEKSQFIELEKPVFWKMSGEHKIMIETVYYNCKL